MPLHPWSFPTRHVNWSQELPVKTDICESKSVPVHVEAVNAPPSPIRVYQTPGAVGIEAEPQLDTWVSIVASAVDPNIIMPTPGIMGPEASSQGSPTICSSSSKTSRTVAVEDNSVEVMSNKYSTPLAAVHVTVLEKNEEEPPYTASVMLQVGTA